MALPNVVLFGDAPIGRKIAGDEQPKVLVKVSEHLGYPLGHQTLWSDNQCSLGQPPQLELTKNESCLYGFAQTDLIGEKVTNTVPGDSARQCPDLVWQRDDG